MIDLRSNPGNLNPPVRIRCSALVFDGYSLLLLKFDDPELGVGWELPGGGIEQSESFVGCARREVAEETGLEVEPTRIAYHLLVIAPDLETISKRQVPCSHPPAPGSLAPWGAHPFVGPLDLYRGNHSVD